VAEHRISQRKDETLADEGSQETASEHHGRGNYGNAEPGRGQSPEVRHMALRQNRIRDVFEDQDGADLAARNQYSKKPAGKHATPVASCIWPE
jgi:hypothetical protein